VTSTVSGRDVGAVDQDDPASNGLGGVWDVQASRLAYQWEHASVHP
jgi:hypothetical protein